MAATRVLGSLSGKNAAPYFYYDKTETAASYKLTLYAGYYFKEKVTGVDTSQKYKITLSGTGKTAKTGSGNFPSTVNAGEHRVIDSFDWNWSKTHSTQSITIKCACATTMNGTTTTWPNPTSKTFTIPAKTSCTVSYNLNGGSGTAPASQTKWYDENLTLTSTVPTKADANNIHYSFAGWADTQAKANAGTVDYKAGGTYTANTAVTLYAVWTIHHDLPSVSEAVTVRRVSSSGGTAEEGTYVKVTVPWTVDKTGYLNNALASIKIEYRKKNSTGSYTSLGTITSGLTTKPWVSGVLGGGNLSADNDYEFKITLTDTNGGVNDGISAYLPNSYFVMDVSPSGYGIGFGTAAPEEDANGNTLTKDTAQMQINMDLQIKLNTSAASGTTDGDLYSAIHSLGWDDCIV